MRNIHTIYNSNPKVERKVDLMTDLTFDSRQELFDFKRRVNLIQKTIETQPTFHPKLVVKNREYQSIPSRLKQQLLISCGQSALASTAKVKKRKQPRARSTMNFEKPAKRRFKKQAASDDIGYDDGSLKTPLVDNFLNVSIFDSKGNQMMNTPMASASMISAEKKRPST